MVWQNGVHWSKHYSDLPCHRIVPPSRETRAVATGPEEGARNIPPSCEPFGRWTNRHPQAYGIGTSLYDCDPIKNRTSGDPIADVYAVVAGETGGILALADGVGWGEQSRLAARCAIAGCLQYLSSHLYTANNTRDIMSILLKAFEHAQECIMDRNAATTTLCVAVVCQLEASERWGLCVVNVGDSLAFTYKTSKGVQEVTIGSHYDEEREMSSPGGSLGPVDGYNPDLRNLTFSFTVLDSGDIVFLTSDGISDNFDPVIAPCRLCETSGNHDIPQYQVHDPPLARHKTMLDDMTKVIQEEGPEDQVSAMGVCAKLISHVFKSTQKKRSFLEQVRCDDHNLVASNREFLKAREENIAQQMSQLPGKLDHAAAVAFEVGYFSSEPLRLASGAQPDGRRRRSLFNDIISGLRNSVNRRVSTDDRLDQHEMSSSSDSFIELY